jgi:hypothetical protein
MNKHRIAVSGTLVLLALILSACEPIQFAEYPNGTPAKTTDRLTADYQNALPVESQLILGALLLENTDQAVDGEQAAELLPLFQKLKSLNGGTTPSAQDKTALLDQIQGTLTPDQIHAMAALQLTQADVYSYMQKAGLSQLPQQTGTPNAPNGGGNLSGDFEESPTPGLESSVTPDDDLHPPDAGFAQDPNLSPDQIATLHALHPHRGDFQGTPSVLLDTLIQLLENKQKS